MIHLGGLLHDLECYVDNSLVKDTGGEIVGREGGIKSWLDKNISYLVPHYKSLMGYKSIAKKIRQIMNVYDPTPTEEILRSGRARPLLNEVEIELQRQNGIFKAVNSVLTRRLRQLDEKLNS